MIKVDLPSLQSLSIRHRRRLPDCPAVYFVLSGDSLVLYVGATMSLRKRWEGHNRLRQIQDNHRQARVAWIPTEKRNLRRLESRCICRFKPLYNGTRSDVDWLGMFSESRLMMISKLQQKMELKWPSVISWAVRLLAEKEGIA